MIVQPSIVAVFRARRRLFVAFAVFCLGILVGPSGAASSQSDGAVTLRWASFKSLPSAGSLKMTPADGSGSEISVSVPSNFFGQSIRIPASEYLVEDALGRTGLLELDNEVAKSFHAVLLADENDDVLSFAIIPQTSGMVAGSIVFVNEGPHALKVQMAEHSQGVPARGWSFVSAETLIGSEEYFASFPVAFVTDPQDPDVKPSRFGVTQWVAQRRGLTFVFLWKSNEVRWRYRAIDAHISD